MSGRAPARPYTACTESKPSAQQISRPCVIEPDIRKSRSTIINLNNGRWSEIIAPTSQYKQFATTDPVLDMAGLSDKNSVRKLAVCFCSPATIYFLFFLFFAFRLYSPSSPMDGRNERG